MSESNTEVRIRPVASEDLPTLFEFQLDTESNQMAFTHPRSADDFDAHWSKILNDPSVVARAIVADASLAGCISCFTCDGTDSIGYWIGKQFWGRGIATRALTLLLEEVRSRPLHSRVAVSNIASIRVLENCGFHEVRREWSPATERYVECEEIVMGLSE